MTTLTEGRYAAEFILSEASGNRSRDKDTVKAGAGSLAAGTVVQRGQDGLLVAFDGNTDSGGALDPEAAGVLIYAVDATGASNVDCTLLARDAEVNSNLLTYACPLADVTRSLKLLGIVTRTLG